MSKKNNIMKDNLKDIMSSDTNVLEEIYKEETNLPLDATEDETKTVDKMIKSDSTKNLPTYQIRVKFDKISTQKSAFTDINEAIKECNKYAGYSVFDEDENVLHISTAPFKLPLNSVKYPGQKYELNNIKLFANSSADTAGVYTSGTYYLYDTQSINERYRVTNKKQYAEQGINYIIGYISIDEIQ